MPAIQSADALSLAMSATTRDAIARLYVDLVGFDPFAVRPDADIRLVRECLLMEASEIVEENLCAEYQAWSVRNGFPQLSADELLIDESADAMSDAQRAYVVDFIARWDDWVTRSSMPPG